MMVHREKEKGIALFLTLICMVSLVIIVSAYLFLVTYNTRNVIAQFNDDRAFYLADAGLNKAVWYLINTAPDSSTDGSWRTSSYPAASGPDPTDPPQESLGAGTYTIWVETSGSDIMVTARGTVGGIERTVRQTITLAAGGALAAFNSAYYSGDSINFLNSTGTINGDLEVVGTVDNEGAMTTAGTITESSSVASPSVDLASYAGVADTTISGNHTFSSGTYSGIWYVDGKVTIDDNVTFNGTIIATGDIVLTNTDDLQVTPSGNYPALVSGNKISGNKWKTSTVNGLIFAATSIDLNQAANNTVNGSLISTGDIDLKNGSDWSITYDPGLASDPPPYFSGSGGGVAAGDGWQEI